MMDEKKLLIKVAEMYYNEDKNQAEISRELGIHRTTISKLLKQSREQGYVNIIINYEAAGVYSIEKNIEELFNIKKAIVIPDQSNNINFGLGKAFASFLNSLIVDGMRIGFSWGKTLSDATQCLYESQTKGVVCLPLIGGPTGLLQSSYHVNTITYDAARRIGADALLIDVPAIPNTIELKQALLENDYNKKLISMWDSVDIAVMGIGSWNFRSENTWMEFYSEKIINELNSNCVVGDVISRFYDYKGNHVFNDIDDRIIGMSLDQLLKVKTRIGIAASLEKVDAIIGALRGHYVNVLITDQTTASAILNRING